MVNSNPETVSTDFDTSDRLYFEPLDEESLRNIIENEESDEGQPPSVVQFGGQTAINLAGPLDRAGQAILGSSVDSIDLAEDRRRFEELMDRLGIPQPPGTAVTSLDAALVVAEEIAYPVLVRPSYVLGGRAMEIVHGETDLRQYVNAAVAFSEGRPILIDKYLEGKEVEVDAICDGDQVLIPGIMEHIERAGVHSGDSMAVYPAINLPAEVVDTLVDYTRRIGLALNVRGLMNIQYVVMSAAASEHSDWHGPEPGVLVLEVNPRASRTVPFLSKVTGVPMVKLATHVMLGKTLAEQGYAGGLWQRQPLVAVKAPVFSMSKLIGVDTYLGPEMKSTGEVMGIDYTYDGALAKALIAASATIPPRGVVLLSIADHDKEEVKPLVQALHQQGCGIYATEGTAALVRTLGIPVELVAKKIGEGHPTVVDVIRDRSVKAVINTVTGHRNPLRDGFEIRRAATENRIPCFTSLDTATVAVRVMAQGPAGFSVLPLGDYRKRAPQT